MPKRMGFDGNNLNTSYVKVQLFTGVDKPTGFRAFKYILC